MRTRKTLGYVARNPRGQFWRRANSRSDTGAATWINALRPACLFGTKGGLKRSLDCAGQWRIGARIVPVTITVQLGTGEGETPHLTEGFAVYFENTDAARPATEEEARQAADKLGWVQLDDWNGNGSAFCSLDCAHVVLHGQSGWATLEDDTEIEVEVADGWTT